MGIRNVEVFVHVLEVEMASFGTSGFDAQKLPIQPLGIRQVPTGQDVFNLHCFQSQGRISRISRKAGRHTLAQLSTLGALCQPGSTGTYSSCPSDRGWARFSTYSDSYVCCVVLGIMPNSS